MSVAEADVERVLDDRERQGLPRRIADPVALAPVVVVLREASERVRPRKTRKPVTEADAVTGEEGRSSALDSKE